MFTIYSEKFIWSTFLDVTRNILFMEGGLSLSGNLYNEYEK